MKKLKIILILITTLIIIKCQDPATYMVPSATATDKYSKIYFHNPNVQEYLSKNNIFILKNTIIDEKILYYPKYYFNIPQNPELVQEVCQGKKKKY
jgi:hypothetical protein